MSRTRDLVGRRIVAVEWNRTRRGRGYIGWTSDPVLVLDNGARVRFGVDETNTGEYGITVYVHKQRRST